MNQLLVSNSLPSGNSIHIIKNQQKSMLLETMFLVPGWILVITLVNVIVYKLRQLQEANLWQQNNNPAPPPSDPLCRRFSLAEIHSATRYFDEAFVIGKGGFGKVYKGVVDGASTVAIKRLDHGKSKQGATEFWTEIEMLSKFRHSHLVSLIGYCNEGNEMVLVYEYMPLGSLSDYLHKGGGPLTWVQRLKICIGAARGLDYLHTGTGTRHRVIHRDVKTSNILLDDNLEARISDFGLSKIGPANQLDSHVSTYFKGTFGYVDPDYFLTWKLTRKSDVYAFGVVLFEIICGRRAVDLSLEENQRGLAGWAQHCVKKGMLDKIVDPRLRGQILTSCLAEFGKIAERCSHRNPRKRPTMAEVVAKLEYSLALQEEMDFSEVEGEIVGIAWAELEKEEVVEDCEEIVNNAKVSDNQQETITEQLDSIAGQSDATSGLTHTKQTGIMTFTKKLRRFLFRKARLNSELKGIQMTGRYFKFRQIKVATRNFSSDNKLGEGGFGSVYRGVLPDGTVIAVKQLSAKSMQGVKEFANELGIISSVQHQNLVKLIGSCAEEGRLLLVYEYMENNSVAHALYGPEEVRRRLNWPTRKNVCLGIARGLAFLHEESKLQFVHRDIKPSNILLDKEYNAKISDFGLAKFYEDEYSHISTRIAGTIGYMAPEYAMRGYLTPKADVYSFGVLTIEIVSGKKNTTYRPNEEPVYLLDLAYTLQQKARLVELVDPALQADYSHNEAITILELAIRCTNPSPTLRPTMSHVVKILEKIFD